VSSNFLKGGVDTSTLFRTGAVHPASSGPKFIDGANEWQAYYLAANTIAGSLGQNVPQVTGFLINGVDAGSIFQNAAVAVVQHTATPTITVSVVGGFLTYTEVVPNVLGYTVEYKVEYLGVDQVTWVSMGNVASGSLTQSGSYVAGHTGQYTWRVSARYAADDYRTAKAVFTTPIVIATTDSVQSKTPVPGPWTAQIQGALTSPVYGTVGTYNTGPTAAQPSNPTVSTLAHGYVQSGVLYDSGAIVSNNPAYWASPATPITVTCTALQKPITYTTSGVSAQWGQMPILALMYGLDYHGNQIVFTSSTITWKTYNPSNIVQYTGTGPALVSGGNTNAPVSILSPSWYYQNYYTLWTFTVAGSVDYAPLSASVSSALLPIPTGLAIDVRFDMSSNYTTDTSPTGTPASFFYTDTSSATVLWGIIAAIDVFSLTRFNTLLAAGVQPFASLILSPYPAYALLPITAFSATPGLLVRQFGATTFIYVQFSSTSSTNVSISLSLPYTGAVGTLVGGGAISGVGYNFGFDRLALAYSNSAGQSTWGNDFTNFTGPGWDMTLNASANLY